MQPDVSFVIAAFNAEDSIARSVESALAQRGVTVEVIVVDDRSSDRTVATAHAIADERVRILALEENRGPGGARNAGLASARGRWIAVLDADDTIHPDRLARLVTRAEDAGARVAVDNLTIVKGVAAANAPSTAFGGPPPPLRRGGAEVAAGRAVDPPPFTGEGDHAKRGGGGVPMFPPALLEKYPHLTLADFIAANLMFEGSFSFGYMKPVIERRFVEHHALRYPEALRIGEDYIFLACALAKGARCVLEPEPLYRYHVRAGSISRVLQLHHVEAMLAADAAFLRGHRLDAAALAAQARRTRSLEEAAAFLDLVRHLKAGAPLKAIGAAIGRPRALRHLRMPIAARLARLARPFEGLGQSA